MRVGFLTLDTFRAGAIEQLDAYARLTDLPLAVAYKPEDVAPALRSLNDCDVVLVDTPGRSPLSVEQNTRWRELLAAIRPDETHLVVPASLRTDAAMALCRSFLPHGITHMILTKADELPNGAGVLDIVSQLQLRARWIASGQEVPFDLKPAKSGIPAAFGATA
jgi:flagellar biosynthesis protein FlhF